VNRDRILTSNQSTAPGGRAETSVAITFLVVRQPRLSPAGRDFWFSEKIVGRCSYFVLAIRDRTIIIAAIPLR
jgi:hypothetical protein